MKGEDDFSKEKRGAVLQSPNRTRYTLMIDNDVIEAFKDRATQQGTGYQDLINEVLREASASWTENEQTSSVREV